MSLQLSAFQTFPRGNEAKFPTECFGKCAFLIFNVGFQFRFVIAT